MSARITLALTAGLMGVLPLGMLLFAWAYEQAVLGRCEAKLASAVDRVSKGSGDLSEVGRELGVEIRTLDSGGRLVRSSSTGARAVAPSPIGGWADKVVEFFGAEEPEESLEEAERSFEPMERREEVLAALKGEVAFRTRLSSSGRTAVFALAAPRAGGGATVALAGSTRGVRRLVGLRLELVKLTVYQGVLSVLFVAALGFWLVRPLERLARGAACYPKGKLADARLLARKDEIGQLARAVDSLASSLERRQKATVDLAADVAHELKNPLATIAASAEHFASTKEPTPEKRRMLESEVLRAVERLHRSADALLGLARLELSLGGEPREEVDYRRLLEELAAEYRLRVAEAGVGLTTEFGPGLGVVTLVPEAWRSLLRNLVDNALVQPSERKGVVLRAERTPDWLVTSVQDFGPGISAANRERIFERFFTLRPEGAPPGTGLGLSIVQAVAEAHGARVEVETVLGQGATFRVILPS